MPDERYEEVDSIIGARNAPPLQTRGDGIGQLLLPALGHLGKRQEAARAREELWRFQPSDRCARARRHLTISAFFLESIVEGMRNAGPPSNAGPP